jgi:hypothetical protein
VFEGSYRQKGDVRGHERGPHHTMARLEGGAPPYGVASPGSPSGLFWTLSLCQQNRGFGLCFVQFQEYFLYNFLEIQK